MNFLTRFIRYALITNVLSLWIMGASVAAPTTTSLVIAPNPAHAGQTLTATVTVAGSDPTRVPTQYVCVKYDDAEFDESCAELVDGQATIAMSAAATSVLGEHRAVASYYGDLYNEGSASSNVNYTVTGVMLQGDARAITVGQSVTLTATVGGNNPGGTVTFKDGTNAIGTVSLSQEQAILAYTFNTAGLHLITAEYSGDSNNPPAVSGSFGISVGVPTTTTLSLSPSVVNMHQSLTATVAVSGENPTGIVCVRYDDGNLDQECGALVNGEATIIGPYLATYQLGSHTATATYLGDSANARSTSASVSYDVIGVTLQADGSQARIGQPLTFTATVGGNNPGGTVRFMDGSNEIGAVTLSEGSAVLTHAFTSGGYHNVTAEYSGDINNSPATSSSYGVAVVVPTTTSLSLSPNPVLVGEEVTATVTISGDNPSGLLCVTFDDGALGQRCVYAFGGQAIVSSPSYATLEPGAHTAVAFYYGDYYLNDSSTSAIASYTVVEEIQNTPPSVSYASPASNSTFVALANITLEASASDVDGLIAKVEFFNGQELLATVTQAPYQYNWTDVAAGTYQLTAKATDNLGTVASSTAVDVTVIANEAPTVSMTATSGNATAPATIALDAIASDVDGSIAKVEFFNGETLVATVMQAPYQYNWTNVSAGSYQLTAVATDNLGGAATSAAVIVTVTSNKAPSVSITATPSNTTAPATVALEAFAADADGSIVQVEFFNGENLLGTTTAAPYTYSWANVATGTYLVIARATDDDGTTSQSPPVFVRVSDANSVPEEPGPSQIYYIQADHLNTPRVITDSNNNIVWRWDNGDPFGNNLPDENPSGLGTFVYNPRFPGQMFDKETNLHYNYYRDYDPQTGRYVQSDPIGLAGGINGYAYVGGNPVSRIDPLGLEEEDPMIARVDPMGNPTDPNYPGVGAGQVIAATTYIAGVGVVVGSEVSAVGIIAAINKARKDIAFDGPSAGLAYGNGRVCQVRYKNKPVFRMDYQPIPGSNNQSRMHIHIGPDMKTHYVIDPRGWLD